MYRTRYRWASLATWSWLAALALAVAGCGPSYPYSIYGTAYPDDPKIQAFVSAADHGDVATVQRLLKQGVNPDKVFSFDGTPLLAIPVISKQPKVLQAMLDAGADPNAKQAYNTGDRGIRYHGNAMVWAAKSDDPTYLRMLLDHGGDPNTRNANNETLMYQAMIFGNQWQNVQLLVEKGARIDELNVAGTLLQDYATIGGFKHAYWLLEHGADPSIDKIDPGKAPDSHIIDAIFWHPGNPKDPTWQRNCQQWLLQHGYKRPHLPEQYRRMRKDLGFPYEEDQIPLL